MKNTRFTMRFAKKAGNVFIWLFAVIAFVCILMELTGGAEPQMYFYFGLFLLPFIVAWVWFRNHRITVNNDVITVRRGIGTQYSFNVADITRIRWRITKFDGGQANRIVVRIGWRRLAIDPMLSNFKAMAAYLEENVDAQRIEKVYKTLPFKK